MDDLVGLKFVDYMVHTLEHSHGFIDHGYFDNTNELDEYTYLLRKSFVCTNTDKIIFLLKSLQF